jgi:hypothetical protein
VSPIQWFGMPTAQCWWFAKRINKKSLFFRGRLVPRISNTGSLAVSKTITKTLAPVQCYIPHSNGPTPL